MFFSWYHMLRDFVKRANVLENPAECHQFFSKACCLVQLQSMLFLLLFFWFHDVIFSILVTIESEFQHFGWIIQFRLGSFPPSSISQCRDPFYFRPSHPSQTELASSLAYVFRRINPSRCKIVDEHIQNYAFLFSCSVCFLSFFPGNLPFIEVLVHGLCLT